MKRLKNILLKMHNNTTTYTEIYTGPIYYISRAESYNDYDNIYWSDDDISVEISITHKLAQDKPTLIWHIPIKKLGFDNISTAAADYCLREFAPYIDSLNAELYNRSRPDNENGKYYLYRPNGEVLTRNSSYFKLCPRKSYVNGSETSVYLLEDNALSPPVMCLCIMMQVQLPKGKLRKAISMLCKDLPDAVKMFVEKFNISKFCDTINLAEIQASIREWLKNSNYCAFIANGSILPRAKGTDLPLENAIPFCSVPEDEIEVCGLRGMGIRRGATVITGGGFSGKSTLLDAIAAGIYDHVIGDGRELCITDDTAITISAEDGRCINHVNISPFIRWLPNGNAKDFSTICASGSTSQAANVMEAIDYGAKLILIDEDLSATNFMIRDRMMRELIQNEPITPFTDRIKELFTQKNVSVILVIGGSGEYLSVADKIYIMENYVIHDVTEKSKKICEDHSVLWEFPIQAEWDQQRLFFSQGFTPYPKNKGMERLKILNAGFIIIGDENIDVRGLHNIITNKQVNTLGFMLRYLEITNTHLKIDIEKRIDELYENIQKESLDLIWSNYFTECERFLDLPRKCELMAVINRMKNIVIKNEKGDIY